MPDGERRVTFQRKPDPDRPDVLAALENLGVEPGGSRYVFRPPQHASPGYEDPYAIWVSPRSMV